MNAAMLKAVDQLPSHKFLPLVYQLASRLSDIPLTPKVSFQAVLFRLVLRMTNDHPHFTLYQLLALASGDRTKAKLKNRDAFQWDPLKKTAALHVLSSIHPRHKSLLAQVQQMADMCIRLAELDTHKEVHGAYRQEVAEGQNGRMEEWRNGRMSEITCRKCTMAEMHNGKNGEW